MRDIECTEHTNTNRGEHFPVNPSFLYIFILFVWLSFFQMPLHAQEYNDTHLPPHTHTHTVHANIYTYVLTVRMHACTKTQDNTNLLSHMAFCTFCHTHTHTHIQVFKKPRQWENIQRRLRLTQADFPVI